MSDLTSYAEPLAKQHSENMQWLRTERQGQLQLPVTREAARARLANAFRSEVTDNKGWIFPRVKFHRGKIDGDVLTLTCTRCGRSPINYRVTGRLLDNALGGLQIRLHIVDDLRLRILLTPFFALIPVICFAYSLGLRGWQLAAAVVLGGGVWAALGTATVYFIAMRQRDAALEDVRQFLTQAALQDPRANTSR